MSLRPNIFGFSIEKMVNLIGCKSQETLDQLTVELDNLVTFRDPARKDQTKEVLRRAVFHRLPWDDDPTLPQVVEGSISKFLKWTDVEDEGEPHVYAAMILAMHGQSLKHTDSSIWKMGSFGYLRNEIEEKLAQEVRYGLWCFTNGRAMFGKRIRTSWSYYGYLSWNAMHKFRLALVALQQAHPEFVGDDFMFGFLDKLIGWLNEIEAENLDLFFYAY